MVVDTEVDVSIVPPLVAAALSDHEQGGGLTATPVPSCRVAGEQRGEEPVTQDRPRSRRTPAPARRRPPRRRGCSLARRTRGPVAPPAHVMHFEPVNVAARPARPRNRSADPRALVRVDDPAQRLLGGNSLPIRRRPSGPKAVFAQDCVATAPTRPSPTAPPPPRRGTSTRPRSPSRRRQDPRPRSSRQGIPA